MRYNRGQRRTLDPHGGKYPPSKNQEWIEYNVKTYRCNHQPHGNLRIAHTSQGGVICKRAHGETQPQDLNSAIIYCQAQNRITVFSDRLSRCSQEAHNILKEYQSQRAEKYRYTPFEKVCLLNGCFGSVIILIAVILGYDRYRAGTRKLIKRRYDPVEPEEDSNGGDMRRSKSGDPKSIDEVIQINGEETNGRGNTHAENILENIAFGQVNLLDACICSRCYSHMSSQPLEKYYGANSGWLCRSG